MIITFCCLLFRSQVFKAMFENEDGLHSACLENSIILADTSPTTFLCLLEFLYTNCCTLNEENVSYCAKCLFYMVTFTFIDHIFRLLMFFLVPLNTR